MAPAATACCRQNPLWGLESESGLRCGGQAALLSCKEDKSRFLLPAKAQNKTAIASGEALLPCLCGLPPARRQPLALENSSEMVQFKELESATGLRTYLCRPHSPWQGGSNENEGGLLRPYCPWASAFTRSRKNCSKTQQNG